MKKTDFEVNNTYNGYKVVKKKYIEERKTEAVEMLHIKSGAKVLYLNNNDNDKAFSITFKTLPINNTGVFHILEHSVLCGSKKFNLKEPFVNLCKGSMASFINAFTFPDKTMYPVSSTNEKDLLNLIDVYMDAVLFPNIYKNKNIFYQEGGHKTVDDNGNLGFNGVVFNEMSGAYTEPSELAGKAINEKLFPDNCYSFEYGGFPDDIKDLTYEQFLDEHRSNYRLDNSYIILYGNLNIKTFLDFLDTNYLSRNNEIAEWQGLNDLSEEHRNKLQPRKFVKQKAVEGGHTIIDMQTPESNKTCAAGYVLDADRKTRTAIRILLSALTSSNESPLKQEILKLKKCEDISFYLHSFLQSTIWVECKKPVEDFGSHLTKAIADAVEKIVEDGIDPEILEATINKQTFVLNENLAVTSHGVDAAMLAMNEWLYDDNCSYTALEYNDLMRELKELCNTNYYNDLARKIFIDNTHVASSEINCVEKLPSKKERIEDTELIKQIKRTCEELEIEQNKPDAQSDIDSLPNIGVEDIGPYKKDVEYTSEMVDGIPHISIETESNQIDYIKFAFDCEWVDFEDIKHISILSSLLGKLDTKNFNAKEIKIYSDKYLGNLQFTPSSCSKHNNHSNVKFKFVAGGSALKENSEHLKIALDEIIHYTKLNNKEKILSILQQEQISIAQNISSSGHANAVNRSLSYINNICMLEQQLHGIDYYIFLTELVKNFDNNYDNLINKLQNLYEKIFCSTCLIVSNSNISNINNFRELITNSRITDKNQVEENYIKLPKPKDNKEAFIVPGNVSYAGMSTILDFGVDDDISTPTKAARITIPTMISYNYLWNEVRIKGGAYGAGLLNRAKNTSSFYSFRDPNPINSISCFKKSSQWLIDEINNNRFNNKDLEKAIISAIAKLDAPTNDRNRIITGLNDAISGQTNKHRQEIRQMIIDVTYDDVVEFCTILNNAMTSSVTCLIGTEEACKKSGLNVIDLFKV